MSVSVINKVKNDFKYCYFGKYKNYFTDEALEYLISYLISKNRKRFNVLDLVSQYSQESIKEYEYMYGDVTENNKNIIKIFNSGYLLYKIH